MFSKSTINVLSHLLIEPTSDGVMHMTGTDYDVVLQASLPAKVSQGGSAAINGKSLFDVVKSLDTPTVHLRTLDNHWVEVTAGRREGGMPERVPAIPLRSTIFRKPVINSLFLKQMLFGRKAGSTLHERSPISPMCENDEIFAEDMFISKQTMSSRILIPYLN